MELTTESGKPGLKVKEPVAALLKAAGSIFFLDGGGTIDNLIDAAGAFGREELSAEQSAHRFWRAAVFHALMDVITRNRLADPKADSERIADVVLDFAPILCKPVSYNAECLEEPTNLAPYRILRAKFWEIAIALQPGQTHDKAKLEGELDNALREAVAKVWLDPKSADFRAYVHNVLSGPVYKGVERRQAWQRHYAWIDHKLSKKALFGQEDTGITLRDVYVPLRCNHHEEVPVEGEGDEAHTPSREKKTRRVAHVGWLHETLWVWLDRLAGSVGAGDVRDSLRVVAGAPGGGKSVFSRVFAHDVAMAGCWQVAYVELQHMAFREDFRDRISNYFRSAPDGMGLGADDVFEMARVPGTPPLLFVFDGLDEISRSEAGARDVTRKFLSQLKTQLALMNATGFRAAAVVLGRPAAVSEARGEVDLNLGAILYVMPLKPLSEKALEVDTRREDSTPSPETAEPIELIKTDQRPNFWAKWVEAKKLPAGTESKAIAESQLDDLTAEPLLFYLLILSGFAERDVDTAAANRNNIYREIFRRVYERDREKAGGLGHQASVKLEKREFFLLMECLALAIWQGGGRTGSETNYEKFRDLHAQDSAEDFKKKAFAQLGNVAMQFYTRAAGESDRGFEFVHKSFGEYLSACAILRAAEDLSAQHKSRSEDFCAAWLKLFGAQPVTPEILAFLKDEARLWTQDRRVELKEKLTRYMNWVLLNGMPANRDGYGSWRVAETHQRNATGALLAALNALACAVSLDGGETVIGLEWPDESAARRMIEMLHITHVRTTAHHLCLGYLDFSKSNRLSHLNLNGADLRGADLIEANLSRAYLNGANLIGADLKGAYLNGANLTGANLSRAYLNGANLTGAYLTGAYLNGADLKGAYLNGANLIGADMSGADLSGAGLNGADLKGADLSGADLKGANLIGADLKGAYLNGADLKGADLSGAKAKNARMTSAFVAFANLTGAEDFVQSQINSAFGNTATLLPEGISRPSHWPDSEDVSELYDSWRAWRQAQHSAEAHAEPTDRLDEEL